MLHIIDGYNLLFFLEVKTKTLREARDYVIQYVAHVFANKKGVCIVFDGKQEKGLGYSRIIQGSVEIIYTADGMSADDFIIEWFHDRRSTSLIHVYTHDKGLKSRLSDCPAKVHDFDELKKPKQMSTYISKTDELSDPRYEQYLLESFTKKLKL